MMAWRTDYARRDTNSANRYDISSARPRASVTSGQFGGIVTRSRRSNRSDRSSRSDRLRSIVLRWFERSERLERFERSERSLFGGANDRNLQLRAAAVANDVDGGGAADGRVLHEPHQDAAVLDGGAVEADDDVAGTQARLERGRGAADALDQQAARIRSAELRRILRRQRCEHDRADRSAPHFAVLQEVVDDAPREVARDREADPLVAAALAEDGGVDADQLAARVHQRAAGVARVDGGVRLNEVFVAGDAEAGAPERGDDAERDGLIELERVADGQHPLRDLQLRRVAPRHRRQAARVDLQQRQVDGRIDADDLRAQLPFVPERDRDGRQLARDAPPF